MVMKREKTEFGKDLKLETGSKTDYSVHQRL